MINSPSLEGAYAILGGSFDPIHNGHLGLACQILELSSTKKVVFMPNCKHRFKPSEVRLSFAERCKNIRLALEPYPGFELWLEDSTGSGYTADLMQRLYTLHPDKKFCFVIGSDNLSSLPDWHDFPWLRENLFFLIIPRPGAELRQSVLTQIQHQVLETIPIDVSSTRIRRLIREGGSIQDMVPDALVSVITASYRRFYEQTR